MTHFLKTWPGFFTDILAGQKTFEICKNDREFHVGDILELREWEPRTEQYTGRIAWRKVTYIMDLGWGGIAPGYVCMSLGDIDKEE
jgi:hypothetical protein